MVTWIVLIIIVVGGQLAYRQVAARRRTAAALAATAATGLAVNTEVEDPPPLPFALFNRGHGRRVRNRMWDPKDPNASVFDYEFTVSSGTGSDSSSRTYHHTCAVYAVPFSSPNLGLSKQRFFDRIAVGFGGTDVQVGNPQFDELYRVQCKDDAFARALLDPQFVTFLLHEGRADEIIIELAGSHVLVATTSRIEPTEFDDLLAWGHRLVAQLPPMRGDRPPTPPAPFARPTQAAMQEWDPRQGPMPAPDAGPTDRPRSTPIE